MAGHEYRAGISKRGIRSVERQALRLHEPGREECHLANSVTTELRCGAAFDA